jgi:chemotaxis protein MotB
MILKKTAAAAALPLAAFLLSACVSQSKYDELQAQTQQLQSQNQQLQGKVAADQAQITRLQGAIKYTVNSDLLFASGSWEMSAAGKQVIAKMAAKLAPTQQAKLVVNGYTDNAPVGRDLIRRGVTTNQDLSQRRADAVMQFMISQGLNPGLVSAQGHGDTDPVAPNDTPGGRAQNRRVEITIATPGG